MDQPTLPLRSPTFVSFLPNSPQVFQLERKVGSFSATGSHADTRCYLLSPYGGTPSLSQSYEGYDQFLVAQISMGLKERAASLYWREGSSDCVFQLFPLYPFAPIGTVAFLGLLDEHDPICPQPHRFQGATDSQLCQHNAPCEGLSEYSRQPH